MHIRIYFVLERFLFNVNFLIMNQVLKTYGEYSRSGAVTMLCIGKKRFAVGKNMNMYLLTTSRDVNLTVSTMNSLNS